MSKRRRIGVWDRLSLHATLQFERRSPRFVPRLGLKRPLIESVNRWTWLKLGRRRTAIVLGTVFVCAVATGVCGVYLFYQGVVGARVAQMLWLALTASIMVPPALLSLASDPRLIVLARTRRALTRSPTSADASRLAHRRSVWNEDAKARAFLLQSGVWGWPLTMLLTLLFPFTIQLARTIMQWTVPDGPTLMPKPAQMHTFFVAVPLLVVIVGFACLLGVYRYLDRRIRAVRRSTWDKTCPECDYPLPDGAIVNDELDRPVYFGPAACSECGTPWPLIPPERMKA